MRRQSAAWALCLLALPLCGSGWEYDAQGRVEGGRMAHRQPGCGGPAPMWYGGVGGRLDVASGPPDRARFVTAIETDLRGGVHQRNDGDRTVVLLRGTPTLGLGTEWFELQAGLYAGNVDPNERWWGFPAGHLRFGRSDGVHLWFDLLDEPECFVATCLLGAHAGIPVDEATVWVGGSLVGTEESGARGRVWGRAAFEAWERRWIPGIELGTAEGVTGPTFGLSLGIGTRRGSARD